MKGEKSWFQRKHEQQMKEISNNTKKRKAKEASNETNKKSR